MPYPMRPDRIYPPVDEILAPQIFLARSEVEKILHAT